MARTIAVRAQATSAEDCAAHHPVLDTDASLTSDSAFQEIESSARLIPTPAIDTSIRPPLRPSAELVAMPARLAADEFPVPAEPPRFASRNWRAEAWDRERERELRAVERRPDLSPRRRSGS